MTEISTTHSKMKFGQNYVYHLTSVCFHFKGANTTCWVPSYQCQLRPFIHFLSGDLKITSFLVYNDVGKWPCYCEKGFRERLLIMCVCMCIYFWGPSSRQLSCVLLKGPWVWKLTQVWKFGEGLWFSIAVIDTTCSWSFYCVVVKLHTHRLTFYVFTRSTNSLWATTSNTSKLRLIVAILALLLLL